MNGKVEISWLNDQYDELLVVVTNYETGSSTSFAAEDYEAAYENALVWLGYDIFTSVAVGP